MSDRPSVPWRSRLGGELTGVKVSDRGCRRGPVTSQTLWRALRESSGAAANEQIQCRE
jgi:hypothetical protein